MPIDLSIEPFEKAIVSLEQALDRHGQDPSDDLIRDACIQRFEFTYEIAHKTLKRHLEQVSPNPAEFDGMPFADLIRSANERSLLRGDWPAWRRYRDMRAKTSHTYDEAVAIEVVAGIPAFVDEVRHLRDELARRVN